MKSTMLKVSAIICVANGIGLVALPSIASQECGREPGGEYNELNLTGICGERGITQCGHSCGGARWAKGYICQSGGTKTSCVTKDDAQTAIERWQSTCHLVEVGTRCLCDWPGSGWYSTSETKPRKACETKPA